MRNLLLSASLALFCVITISNISYADCTFVGNTPDGGNIINCPAPIDTDPLNGGSMPQTTNNDDELNIPAGGGLNVTGNPAVEMRGGADEVNTSGSIITDTESALNTQGGGDTITVNSGQISTTGANAMGINVDAIRTGGGSDSVTINDGIISSSFARGIITSGAGDLIVVNGGTITGATRSISMGGGQDTLRINGGTFNEQIRMGANDDNVLITGGTFNNTVGNSMINLRAGSDYLNIAADVDLTEHINCGNDNDMMDFDTIEFSMEVPAQDVPDLEDELNSQDPQDGSIVIDGILYEWINCERLRANFNGIVTILNLDPVASEVNVLDEATVTVTVISDNNPAPGLLVQFEITEGPNAGEMSDPGTGECFPDSCVTDANGQVSWTISSNNELGEDFIIATIDNPELGEVSSNIAQITWVVIRNIPTLSEWGIMAMAGFLGLAGLLFIRRKKASA